MNRILTFAALLSAAALRAQGPDPLIYVSSEATYAHRLFEQCQYDQALDWMQRAIAQLRGFRSADPRQRDTAALLARLEFERDQLRRRRNQLRAAPGQLEPLLQAGQLQTLRSRINELAPPACEAGLQTLSQRAEARAAQAAALVQTADKDLDQGQAGRALKLYREAQQLNREHPGLPERLARARALKPPGRAAAIVGKTLLTTVVVAGIGYAGYWI